MAGRILLAKIYIWKYSTTNKLIKARTGTAGNSTKKKGKRKKKKEKSEKYSDKNIPRSNYTLCTNLKSRIRYTRFIIIPPTTDKILCEKLARVLGATKLRDMFAHFSRNEVASAGRNALKSIVSTVPYNQRRNIELKKMKRNCRIVLIEGNEYSRSTKGIYFWRLVIQWKLDRLRNSIAKKKKEKEFV